MWPTIALAAPTGGSERLDAVAALAEAATVHPPAPRTLRGVVDRVDERNDTLLIRLSPDRTESFKVQDGLIFNAVRFGDPVEISVQNIAGFRTIVGLSKQ
ncbi:hypothetical protein FDV58_30405 [Bradyrhizobium elkanii]|uniref:Uncharacterized protein n=1 Tax=Bradyrhizobium elkanii TaxID=29448 RepID=A0A4U6RSA3_BRAEL|nr:hypothetical protein [Bradyrhizobium sp. BR2003]TKV77694.1 hypothetical protein FDV58_30405 [Bradyrhizobium elkanii]